MSYQPVVSRIELRPLRAGLSYVQADNEPASIVRLLESRAMQPLTPPPVRVEAVRVEKPLLTYVVSSPLVFAEARASAAPSRASQAPSRQSAAPAAPSRASQAPSRQSRASQAAPVPTPAPQAAPSRQSVAPAPTPAPQAQAPSRASQAPSRASQAPSRQSRGTQAPVAPSRQSAILEIDAEIEFIPAAEVTAAEIPVENAQIVEPVSTGEISGGVLIIRQSGDDFEVEIAGAGDASLSQVVLDQQEIQEAPVQVEQIAAPAEAPAPSRASQAAPAPTPAPQAAPLRQSVAPAPTPAPSRASAAPSRQSAAPAAAPSRQSVAPVPTPAPQAQAPSRASQGPVPSPAPSRQSAAPSRQSAAPAAPSRASQASAPPRASAAPSRQSAAPTPAPAQAPSRASQAPSRASAAPSRASQPRATLLVATAETIDEVDLSNLPPVDLSCYAPPPVAPGVNTCQQVQLPTEYRVVETNDADEVTVVRDNNTFQTFNQTRITTVNRNHLHRQRVVTNENVYNTYLTNKVVKVNDIHRQVVEQVPGETRVIEDAKQTTTVEPAKCLRAVDGAVVACDQAAN